MSFSKSVIPLLKIVKPTGKLSSYANFLPCYVWQVTVWWNQNYKRKIAKNIFIVQSYLVCWHTWWFNQICDLSYFLQESPVNGLQYLCTLLDVENLYGTVYVIHNSNTFIHSINFYILSIIFVFIVKLIALKPH
jgi:hypothetical protein